MGDKKLRRPYSADLRQEFLIKKRFSTRDQRRLNFYLIADYLGAKPLKNYLPTEDKKIRGQKMPICYKKIKLKNHKTFSIRDRKEKEIQLRPH